MLYSVHGRRIIVRYRPACRDVHTYIRLTALCPGLPGRAGKTNLDFTEARDGEWQWHQLGHYASLRLAPDR